MKFKQPLIILFFLGLLGLLAFYASNKKDSFSTGATEAIQVVDATGKIIALEKPAKRIVSLAPHITENIYSAGAGHLLVGVVSYSNYPEAAKALPIVGGYHKINIEKIIALNPDLIIAWQTGNAQSSLQRLRELGFTVYLDQPNHLLDIAKSIRDIGILTQQQTKANAVAKNFSERLIKLQKKYTGKEVVSTFYQVWNQPLQTINGKHIISEAIKLCGGRNIYADEIILAPRINLESILQRNPQVIIASGMGASRPDWLDDWKQWRGLQAVQQDNLFFVDPDHIQRHTVRFLLGIESICSHLSTARTKLRK